MRSGKRQQINNHHRHLAFKRIIKIGKQRKLTATGILGLGVNGKDI